MGKRVRSRLLQVFIEEIQRKNRNPDKEHIRILEMLADMDTNSERILPSGTELYRCRIVHKGEQTNKNGDSDFYGFDAAGCGVAPWDKTRDMRANYKYIPYLYCANHPYAAVVEVRPRLGASVSVATMRVKEKEELRILDLTMVGKSRKAMDQAKKNLFEDLSELYCTPVTEEDDTLEYIPTQYIAEYVKNKGYDGLAFKSSLTPEWNETGADRYNVVVFSYDKCQAVRSNLVEVGAICYKITQVDEDAKRLEIHTRQEQRWYENGSLARRAPEDDSLKNEKVNTNPRELDNGELKHDNQMRKTEELTAVG